MNALLAINKAFEILQQTLEERKRTLLSEVEAISLSKTTALTFQKKQFEKIVEDIRHYSEVAFVISDQCPQQSSQIVSSGRSEQLSWTVKWPPPLTIMSFSFPLMLLKYFNGLVDGQESIPPANIRGKEKDTIVRDGGHITVQDNCSDPPVGTVSEDS